MLLYVLVLFIGAILMWPCVDALLLDKRLQFADVYISEDAYNWFLNANFHAYHIRTQNRSAYKRKYYFNQNDASDQVMEDQPMVCKAVLRFNQLYAIEGTNNLTFEEDSSVPINTYYPCPGQCCDDDCCIRFSWRIIIIPVMMAFCCCCACSVTCCFAKKKAHDFGFRANRRATVIDYPTNDLYMGRRADEHDNSLPQLDNANATWANVYTSPTDPIPKYDDLNAKNDDLEDEHDHTRVEETGISCASSIEETNRSKQTETSRCEKEASETNSEKYDTTISPI